MAPIKRKYSRSNIEILVAFFVPLVLGFLTDRIWEGLVIGVIIAIAVWKIRGGKLDDLKDPPV